MNTPLRQPIDAVVRERALDPALSFCVTAPAGSGKTELLSQRVLRLLAQAEQPEEILAITFTRKAAAEMQERIIAALQRAATEPEPNAEHKRHTWQLARAVLLRNDEREWNLLQNPARLRVLTIDGLCASLTRQLPILSTFGGSVAITDDAESLYREAISALFELLEQDHPIADALAALLLHLDNDGERLQRLLISLLANRDQWLRYIGGGIAMTADESEFDVREKLEQTLHTIIGNALDQATLQLRRYQGELVPLLDFAGVRMQEMDRDHAICQFAGCVDLPAVEPEAISLWQTLTTVLLTGTGDWRKQVNKAVGFPVGENAVDKKLFKARKEAMVALLDVMRDDDTLLEALNVLRHLPAPEYPDAQWQILRQLMVLLPVVVAQLKVVFQQHGEVDYAEVAQAALHALGEADNPGDLLLRLDARIRHILVDEFQDTSSSQFHLLERLLEGWQEHNANNQPQQTLFIVGDGMQSIYGFRAANVGLFLGARKRGVNGVALQDTMLTVNFRSTPTIVNWVNETFVRAFPAEEQITRGAVPYEFSHAFNDDRAGSEVCVFGMRRDQTREREAAQCVELVRKALAASDDGEIAILVRNRGHLRAIVPALSAAGISWRAADIDPLAARTAVLDLLTLLKALSNLADRIAWLALLRSPLIGLDNRDLHTLIAGTDGRGIYRSVWSQINDELLREQLSAEGVAALMRACEALGAALAMRDRKSQRSWLEGVWLALGGPLCLASDDDWRNVYALFDLVENLPASADIKQLEKRVETLYAKPPVLSGARLWLMTIHKSKGLEFDTVIIPGLERSPRSDDKSLLLWGEYLNAAGGDGLVLAPTPAFGAGTDAIYNWLDFERKQKQQLEDTRLFYVAATRAISRLYLIFCDNRAAKDDQSSEEKPFVPASRSLLSRIWSAVNASVTWLDAKPAQISLLDINAESDDSHGLLSRVPPQWRLSAQSAASESNPFSSDNISEINVSGMNVPEINVSEKNLPEMNPRVDTVETVAGTLVHRIFEQCAKTGIEHWLRRKSDQQRQFVGHLLKQQGIAAILHEAVIDKVLHALNTALADTRGRWLFDPAHTEAVAEWDLSVDLSSTAFNIESGAENRRLIVDRSFIDADGVRWIVDYKTSMPRDGETLELFVAREQANYRAQLFGYRDAVAAFETRPIRLALYFPCVPAWYEL